MGFKLWGKMATSNVLVISFLIVGCFKNVFNSPVKRAAEMPPNTHVETVLKSFDRSRTDAETLEGVLNPDDMMEGDMFSSTNRNAVKNLWPEVGGQIALPYTISPGLAERTDDIEAALNMISSRTCVDFYPRNNEQNYIVFTQGNGCASQVGYIGGRQVVIVGPPCSVGNIAHEVLHTLGFHHEHTRKDRQQYIDILYDNIMGDMKGNFQEKNGNTLGLPYDIASIMHYGGYFFSLNGKPTIKAKETVKDMGQRAFLTGLDVDRVRRLYQCDTKDQQDLPYVVNSTTTTTTTTTTVTTVKINTTNV